MNWIDEGFLINKNRYSENSLIAELYTKERGKISGIIFGGTSKKIKNYFNSRYTFPIIIRKKSKYSRKMICEYLEKKCFHT